MGVPAFNRWLVSKYPKVVANAVEAKWENNYLDTSSTNPNGIEFDNLYLDLNNIIHPCFHPEDDDDDDEQFPPPKTFEEVFENMFKYIDRIFNIIRPRKLLYMAIDGVAPRAKMNQQRTRRFRNANDIKIAEEEELRVKRQFEMDGKEVLPKQETELSDPNIITPGTKFMQDMSNALKNYIKLRLSNDLGWRDIKVILSDSNVPGEGEHKIMSFIRQQRKLPSYNPNTRHCLYGLDADLIMLALAAHEVHFSLLREVVYVEEQQSNLSYKPYPDKSQLTPAATSSSLPCRRWFPNVSNSEEKHGYSTVKLKHYEFLHVWILREYLELDMQISDPPESFKFDIERIVDDFIFMCFFVGNDFLPRTPSLKLPEGAIDLLMDVYKKELKNIGGYLVDMVKVEDKEAEFIKLSRVEKVILLVGTYEEKIFKRRSELWEQKLKQVSSQHVNYDSCNASAIVSLETKSCDYFEMLIKNTKEFKQTVKDNLRRKSNLFNNVDSLIDKVKLVCPGYKERYYREKFCAYNADEIEITRINVVRHYTEGLIWVLLYYFSETPSWTCVHVLPVAYQTLMKDDSPIIDFYTTDFEIDMDGCRYTWQGVCKLPFIDESRLLSETKKLVKDLGVEESERNMHKCDQLLVRSTHKLGSHILSVSTHGNSNTEGTSLSEEIGGILRLRHKYTVMDEVHTSNEDFVLCADYEPSDCGTHFPRLLDGVKLPEKIIKEKSLKNGLLWHKGCFRFVGIRPDKRYNINIHDRLRKVSINSEHMHNGYGREKAIGFDYDSKAHNINTARLSRENGNFHCDQDNSVQAYGSCEKWKKVTTPWGTSLTQPNRIDQPWNSNVWQSRRAASSHNISRADVSNNWRRGSWKTNDYSSMQAKEKGQSFHHS